MVGSDFMGPISPISQKGNRYVYLQVDYATGKLFLKCMPDSRGWRVAHFQENEVSSTFGWPRLHYSDNGKQFVHGPFPKLMQQHGVHMAYAPPSHPSSVGLAESQVKQVRKMLQAFIQDYPAMIEEWDNVVLAINKILDSKPQRPHGFSAWQMIMGSNPRWDQKDVTIEEEIRTACMAIQLSESANDSPWSKEMHFETRLAKLDEIRNIAFRRREEQHKRQILNNKKERWHKPQVNDLVLKRRFHLDNQKSHKLELRWTGPYKLTRLSHKGQAAKIEHVLPGVTEIHHINNLKVYVPREHSVRSRDWINMSMLNSDRWKCIPQAEKSEPEAQESDIAKEIKAKVANDIKSMQQEPQVEDAGVPQIDMEDDEAYWFTRALDLTLSLNNR
ncbi:hypothetical protein AC579_5313 [Pseudocercospora musae]|uniref:Integrase catalytic domain-containing protein n=1 Tax=Pseudocercospora musae TaxID=113226 RepID=A0A139HZI1_9PEZI|nr:hypothetical protein AC579_5313 [Pseudocercospora musae]